MRGEWEVEKVILTICNENILLFTTFTKILNHAWDYTLKKKLKPVH